MNHWHETKARLLNVIKTVALQAQKMCCPSHAHIVLVLLGAPGCRSLEIWVHPQSTMHCCKVLALVSPKPWKQHSHLSMAIHFG